MRELTRTMWICFLPVAGLYRLGAAGVAEASVGGGDLVSPSGLSPASVTSLSSSITQSGTDGDTRSQRSTIFQGLVKVTGEGPVSLVVKVNTADRSVTSAS